MKENLSLALSESLNEDVTSLVSDIAEIGIDSVMDEGLLKEIPFLSTIVGVYNIGKTIKELHEIKKIEQFILSINSGIVDDNERIKHIEKLKENPKERSKELEYVIILLDRLVEDSSVELLSKVYLAYLSEKITLIEFKQYSELIERLLPGDVDTLTKHVIKTDEYSNVDPSALRLIGLGLMYESSGRIMTATTDKDKEETLIIPGNEREYKLTFFGEKFLSVIN